MPASHPPSPVVLKFWLPPLLRLVVLATVSAVAGFVFGAAYGFALATLCLLVVSLIQLHYLHRLAYWIQHPKDASLPDGWGAWETVFSQLYRSHRVRERSRDRLESALARFRHASSVLPDGVILLTTDNYIDWCNAAAERHLQIDATRDRGLLVTNLVRHPNFAEYLDQQNFREPFALRIGNGSIISLQLVPFEQDNKMLISRDVTQLERVETVRRDFIANVSHELRTPLTVIGGFLETLVDAPHLEPDIARKHFALMHEQAQRMQRLVDDLLTLSRLETHGNLLREEPLDVPGLVGQLVTDAGNLSQGRHTITLDCAPAWLTGSGDELRSAFGNLINNAVRYTPEGGRVSVSWRVENGQGIFSVEDTGVGIAAEHIPRLTERFYRVDRSRSRETGGTGLGLAIVKHVLTRHQATLDIRSMPGEGSRFIIVFPPQRLLPPQASAQAA